MWDNSLGNINPLNTTAIEEYHAYSPVAALQVGAEYKISSQIFVGLHAKYYIHDYSTSLKPTSNTLTEINHKNSNSIAIGLRFQFWGSK